MKKALLAALMIFVMSGVAWGETLQEQHDRENRIELADCYNDVTGEYICGGGVKPRMVPGFSITLDTHPEKSCAEKWETYDRRINLGPAIIRKLIIDPPDCHRPKVEKECRWEVKAIGMSLTGGQEEAHRSKAGGSYWETDAIVLDGWKVLSMGTVKNEPLLWLKRQVCSGE